MKGIKHVHRLDYIGGCSAVTIPSDVPSEISDLYSYYMIYKYAQRDGGTYIINPKAAPYIMDMVESLGRKTGHLFETISPLKFRPETLAMGLMFAGRERYLGIAPMIMGGSTGPITMAGTLTLITAEVLASIFAHNAVSGQFCAFFGHSSHTIDPKTILCSFGLPNQALIGIGGNFLSEEPRWSCWTRQAYSMLTEEHVFLGFDAFVDVVATPSAGGAPSRRRRVLAAWVILGQYVQGKDDGSCFVELEEISEKLGGNMAIVANALAGLGVQTHCVGSFGLPNVHPVF